MEDGNRPVARGRGPAPRIEALTLRGQQFPHHAAVYVGEAYVSAAEPVDEPAVVQPQLVQDRGMDVVDHKGVLDDRVAEFVRLPERAAPLEAAPSQGDAVAVDVVVPATDVGDAHGVRRAAHL